MAKMAYLLGLEGRWLGPKMPKKMPGLKNALIIDTEVYYTSLAFISFVQPIFWKNRSALACASSTNFDKWFKNVVRPEWHCSLSILFAHAICRHNHFPSQQRAQVQRRTHCACLKVIFLDKYRNRETRLWRVVEHITPRTLKPPARTWL